MAALFQWQCLDYNDTSKRVPINLTKGTLIQIWKPPYMFVFMQKQYPDFAFLILRILELFAREVCKFVKK